MGVWALRKLRYGNCVTELRYGTADDIDCRAELSYSHILIFSKPAHSSRPYSRILYSNALEDSSKRSAARVLLPPVRSRACLMRRRSRTDECFFTDSSSSGKSGESSAATGLDTWAGRSSG